MGHIHVTLRVVGRSRSSMTSATLEVLSANVSLSVSEQDSCTDRNVLLQYIGAEAWRYSVFGVRVQI